MGKYNGAVITTAGQNLIAQAIAESKTVTFTTAQASSHVYPSSTDFEALTALTDVEKTVDINYAGVYSDTVVQVSARFDNTGVETAYLINTLGFFAQLGTDTPILFAVSTAVTPDQMPVYDADNPSAFVYNLQATVQNADQVTVDVNPAGTVTVDQLNTVYNQLVLQINGKAPTSHASTATTYGAGDSTNYGHVKLTDTYGTVSASQKANNSVGASAWALQTVNGFIGKLSDLTTTVKTSIVAAINELKTTVDSKLDATANAVSATKLLNSRNFRTNLGSTSTAGFDGSADCNPGVTGTLAVANGGTGQTTLAKVRNAMGLGDTTGALPIANGGTGASTAANARSNLGVPPTSHASTGTSYGAGNASNYGHVKVSDNYKSSAGNASQSVAASSKAVYDCYNATKTVSSDHDGMEYFMIGGQKFISGAFDVTANMSNPYGGAYWVTLTKKFQNSDVFSWSGFYEIQLTTHGGGLTQAKLDWVNGSTKTIQFFLFDQVSGKQTVRINFFAHVY